MSNQIRDLFHTIKTSDLTGSQIQSGFGEIYLSKDTIENQLVSQEIISQVQSTKAPFYGLPIPGSFQIETTAGEPGYFQITANTAPNKTYRIEGVSVTNAGLSPITASLELGDGANFCFIDTSGSLASGATFSFTLNQTQHFDNSINLYGLVSSGTEVDAVFNVVYVEIIQ